MTADTSHGAERPYPPEGGVPLIALVLSGMLRLGEGAGDPRPAETPLEAA